MPANFEHIHIKVDHGPLAQITVNPYLPKGEYV